MSLVTTPVLVQAQLPDETPLAASRVTAELTEMEFDGLVVVPALVTAAFDGLGDAILNLWPNERGGRGTMYKITIWYNERRLKVFYIAVPEVPDGSDPISVASITTNSPYPSYDDAQQAVGRAAGYSVQAGQYRDTAKGYRDTVVSYGANINLIAADIANIDAVAGNLVLIAAVNTNAANITTVAGISGSVTTVAGISGSVTTVAGIAANVTTVAGISGNVTTVAGVAANVTTVANNVGNVNVAASNISGINNFALIYQVAATAPTLRADGSALRDGDLYYNTATQVLNVRLSGAWTDWSAQAAASASTAVNAPGTSGTSTTSLTVGTGAQSLTTQTGKAWVVGQFVTISSTANPANWMHGRISAYTSGTGAMTVQVLLIGGSGTVASWSIGLSGPNYGLTDQTSLQPTSLTLPSIRPVVVMDFANGKTVDPRLTVTRASTGTYIDAYGNRQTAAANVPRIDHDPVTLACKGLLGEPARTNLVLNSDTLSTQNVTVTAQAYTLSIEGTGTVTLTGTSTAGPLVGTGTGAKNRQTLTFTPTAGTLTLTVSGSVTFGQLEAGAQASAYIPTAGAQVTRAADFFNVASSNYTALVNANEGTFFEEFVKGFAGGGVFGGFGDQGNGKTFRDNGAAFNLQRRGLGSADMGLAGSLASGTTNKVAMAYSSIAATTEYLALNGVVTSAAVMVPDNGAYVVWRIGGSDQGASGIQHVKRVALYAKQLTSSELAALTT